MALKHFSQSQHTFELQHTDISRVLTSEPFYYLKKKLLTTIEEKIATKKCKNWPSPTCPLYY